MLVLNSALSFSSEPSAFCLSLFLSCLAVFCVCVVCVRCVLAVLSVSNEACGCVVVCGQWCGFSSVTRWGVEHHVRVEVDVGGLQNTHSRAVPVTLSLNAVPCFCLTMSWSVSVSILTPSFSFSSVFYFIFCLVLFCFVLLWCLNSNIFLLFFIILFLFCFVLFCFVVMPKFNIFCFIFVLSCFVVMPKFKHIFCYFYYFTFVWSCLLCCLNSNIFYFILFYLVLFYFIILHCVCQEYVYILFQTIVFQKSQEIQLICSLWISDSVFFTAYFQFNVICFVTFTHTHLHTALFLPACSKTL